MFTKEEIERFHAAAKMIEADGVDAIQTCTRRFGKDIAGALLVAFIRKSEGSMDSWPAPDHVVPNTNAALERHGLVESEPQIPHECPRCTQDSQINNKQRDRCLYHGGCTKCGWSGVKTEEHITSPCDCLEGLR